MSDQPSLTTASPTSEAPAARRRRPLSTRVQPPSPSSSAPALHPLVRRHYRVATAAIEELVDLVEHCVRLLIPGALVHARPRMGVSSNSNLLLFGQCERASSSPSVFF